MLEELAAQPQAASDGDVIASITVRIMDVSTVDVTGKANMPSAMETQPSRGFEVAFNETVENPDFGSTVW